MIGYSPPSYSEMMVRYFICVLILGLAASAPSLVHSPYKVAFSAGLTRHVALGGGQTLLLDRIFLNIGNAYNHQTGTFICPWSGIYSFQMSALTRKDKEAWLDLTVNGKLIVSSWGRTDFATATNSVILHLKPGDLVRIQARRDTTFLFGAPNQVYATFSGYQIFALW